MQIKAFSSEIKKTRKKVKKNEKWVLTFLAKFDKIHKLTRAADRRIGTEP